MLGRTLQETFASLLITVLGGAFTAAGYALEDSPTQQAGGMFRFRKTLGEGRYAGLYAYIEFQHLAYSENRPSLFRVTLIRSDQASALIPSRHPAAARKTLAGLVVDDFGVQIVASADHWWSYRHVTELGRALGEAGSLAVAYGMGWLDGSLDAPA